MNTVVEMTRVEMTNVEMTSIAKAKVEVDSSASISSLFEHDEEQSAIARTLDGDIDAFNSLVIRYQNFAYSIAFRMLQSREAASDAVQDSFMKAFRALSTFKYGAFKSWLARIVVNTCLDAIRIDRRIRWEELMDEPAHDPYVAGEANFLPQIADEGESPQAFVERTELSARMELGIRSLPYDQRLVLILSDIHGYHYDEICEIARMPMGTVKSRISRARLKLRDFLLDQPELLPAEFALSKQN